MEIEGAIVIVTGANRGLGRQFVLSLIQAKAKKIYACARDKNSLPDFEGNGITEIVKIKLDITSEEDIRKVASYADDISLLINNAGILKAEGLIQAKTLDNLKKEMSVNVFGPARMIQTFSSVLSKNEGGAILNVLSVSSLLAFAPFGTYSASKAAAMSLTHSCRYELKDSHVTVHGLYAGFIDTEMINHIKAEKSSPEEIVEAALDGIKNNVLDIYADQTAKAVKNKLREDPEGLVASSWALADSFLKYP
tara:strand:+ start:60 stop:812 length:753 start_codon:yes stop_codon:yes gene_type:complete